MHIVPYQPKSNHPWRRYKQRDDEVAPQLQVREAPKSKLIPFLKEIIDNIDTYDIGARDAFASGRLKYMKDATIALWLIDMLKRNFMQSAFEEGNDE